MYGKKTLFLQLPNLQLVRVQKGSEKYWPGTVQILCSLVWLCKWRYLQLLVGTLLSLIYLRKVNWDFHGLYFVVESLLQLLCLL